MRLVIAEKGLACEERDVSLPQSEHKEPWFMRLNLGEEVPVIIHRDNIISDYDQIIDYVERTFTGGTTATQAQTVPRKLGKPGNPPPQPPTQAWSPRQGTMGYRPGSDTLSRILRSPRTPTWSAGAVASSQELRSHRLGYRPSRDPQA